MPIKGRNQPGNPHRPSGASGADALTRDGSTQLHLNDLVQSDGDLTGLGLGDLIDLPLEGGDRPPVFQAQGSADAPDDGETADFSTLSLEDLLSISVSGEDQPEQDDTQEEAPTKDEAPADAPDGQDQGDSGPGSDGGASLIQELQVEAIDWLMQEDDGSLLDGDHGWFDQDVAVAGYAGSLSLGIGLQATLGNQPVPSAVPAAPADPVQTWFTPFGINLVDGTIGEAWSMADTVGRVRASGADGPVSFVLVDDAGGRFAIDGATGDVTIVGGPFDFAAQSVYTIVVEASDGGRTLADSFTIQVSPGNDDLAGLPGDQVLFGASGSSDDTLFGGAGNDTLSGGNGDDELHGGSGDDTLLGGNHDDLLFGGSGDDVLNGGNHSDRLYGGTGDDELHGGNHDDLLFGGGNDDSLYGDDGNDELYGQGGSDRLDGGAGSDLVFGGTGDDVLVWDPEDSRFDGGYGNDQLLVLTGDIDLTAFTGDLVSIECVDLLSDPSANTLSLSADDVLDMTDNGLLSVLGDDLDRVSTDDGWTLSRVEADGSQLYLHSVDLAGVSDVVGLLLGPGVQLDPQDGG